MRSEREIKSGWLKSVLVMIGASGLMLAMMTDTLAVIGRHIGMPLLGSIELFRAFACLAAISSLVLATLADTHASVNFLTERLSKLYANALDNFSNIVAAIVCIAIAFGLSWTLFDQIGGHEQSEVLGIPYIPLRAYCVLGLGTTSLIFLHQAFKGRDS
eukprot:GHVR01040340.1.p1 GENE.GHVR01040340.1~~GHVR01040340.1.p1  ORF type:complete len:159 (+),score=2.55 GHVR01040340.1:127-603(+)